ncbi:MAG: type II toxin-antitoxin system RelE family toxin [Nanoarchaeota archaeon]
MREYAYSDTLKKILKKLSKKDKQLYEQVMKKIIEVVNASDIEHYKNLKSPLQFLKRVHVGSFVLTFEFDKKNSMVSFEDFQHHDKIYKA